MPFISFYDYITSREITQEKNEKIDKKIKHFECLHQFFYFKSVKLPGSSVAGPVVHQILSEVLPYLGIQSDTTDSDSTAETISLPNVKNKTIAEAKKILEKQGFTCEVSGDSEDLVSEQMPVAGTSLIEGSIVKLYSADNDTKVSQSVPNLKGMSLSEAKAALRNKNLNIKYSGAGKVITQSITAGTSVEEGTVIDVVLQEEIEE